MSAIKVSSEFPIPEVRQKKYPWETMKVGESFPLESSRFLYSYTSGANKRYKPKKFRAGKAEDGSLRIWRIK